MVYVTGLACDGCQIYSATGVDNGDGTWTYTISFQHEFGGGDNNHQGVAFEFSSSLGTLTVLSFTPTMNFAYSGGDQILTGTTGSDIGSISSDFSYYGSRTDVLAYEYDDPSFFGMSQTSDRYTDRTIVVTLDGCIEEFTYNAHARLNIDGCKYDFIVGTCSLDPCPANDQSMSECDGTFDLTSVESAVSGASSGYTYSWSVGSPASYSGTDGEDVTVTVSGSGCTDADATVSLAIPAGPSLTAINYSSCDDGSGNNTGLFDLTANEGTLTGGASGLTVTWWEDANATTTQINSPNSYTSAAKTVYARVENSDGCVSIEAVPLTVGDVESNDVSIDVCGAPTNATIDLTTEHTNINASAGSGYTVNWYENDNQTAAITDPTQFVTTGATIYAYVTEDGGACNGQAEVTVNVTAGPTLTQLSSRACDDGSGDNSGIFDLTANEANITQGVNSPTVTWWEDASTNSSQITSTSAYKSVATTIYALVSSGTCEWVVNLDLEVGDIETRDTTAFVCDDGTGSGVFDLTTLNLTVNNGTSNAVTWWEDAATTTTQITNENVYSTGARTIYARVSGGATCFAIATVTLGVSPSVNINLAVDLSSKDLGTPFIFDNSSTPNDGTVTYTWDFGDGITTTDNNTEVSYGHGQAGSYTVTLSGASQAGCTGEGTIDVEVTRTDLVIHFPNAFTPNSDDLNDDFGPILNPTLVSDYKFFVYSRWGELVFKSTNPTIRWDGTYQNQGVGTEQAEGVYTYKLSVVNAYGERQKAMTGFIMLMR